MGGADRGLTVVLINEHSPAPHKHVSGLRLSIPVRIVFVPSLVGEVPRHVPYVPPTNEQLETDCLSVGHVEVHPKSKNKQEK